MAYSLLLLHFGNKRFFDDKEMCVDEMKNSK